MSLKNLIQATENTERDAVFPASVIHSKSESKFHDYRLFLRVGQKHAARSCANNFSVNSVFSVANLGFR